VMDHQSDTTPARRTTRSGTPFSPPRGDDVPLARLKHVQQDDDSLASGSLYHHRDNNVDDDEGLGDVNVAPDDSYSITSIVNRGGGRGRGQGHGRGRGRGASVPEEDYTGMKVAFAPDTSLWPENQRLSDRIHKDKHLTMYNRMPPPGAMKDGKIVAVVGKRRTAAHRNKYEVNFEYSFFNSMFVRRDVIKMFLVPGDMAPSQSTLPTANASILAHSGTCATRHAARVAASRTASQTGTHGPRVSDVAAVVLPMNETSTAIQTPSRRSFNNNQPSQTPGHHIQGLAPSVRIFLTRVSGNEAGDCPHSESDDEEEKPSQGFYTNPLFSEEPWTRPCTY
jgi:hypothetical protein